MLILARDSPVPTDTPTKCLSCATYSVVKSSPCFSHWHGRLELNEVRWVQSPAASPCATPVLLLGAESRS